MTEHLPPNVIPMDEMRKQLRADEASGIEPKVPHSLTIGNLNRVLDAIEGEPEKPRRFFIRESQGTSSVVKATNGVTTYGFTAGREDEEMLTRGLVSMGLEALRQPIKRHLLVSHVAHGALEQAGITIDGRDGFSEMTIPESVMEDPVEINDIYSWRTASALATYYYEPGKRASAEPLAVEKRLRERGEEEAAYIQNRQTLADYVGKDPLLVPRIPNPLVGIMDPLSQFEVKRFIDEKLPPQPKSI